jgi:hypothetical protein
VTWPDRIAAAIGILTALLLTTPHQHKHRSTTEQHQHPQDGEQS